jgi:hypothetical protein
MDRIYVNARSRRKVRRPVTIRRPEDWTAHGAFARELLNSRRLITRYFDPALFADPALDILLDLYAATAEGKKVGTSSACIAAAVPSTTALRWIARLKAMKLIEDQPDPTDGRRKWLTLTIAAHAQMTAYLERINPRIVPANTN